MMFGGQDGTWLVKSCVGMNGVVNPSMEKIILAISSCITLLVIFTTDHNFHKEQQNHSIDVCNLLSSKQFYIFRKMFGLTLTTTNYRGEQNLHLQLEPVNILDHQCTYLSARWASSTLNIFLWLSKFFILKFHKKKFCSHIWLCFLFRRKLDIILNLLCRDFL